MGKFMILGKMTIKNIVLIVCFVLLQNKAHSQMSPMNIELPNGKLWITKIIQQFNYQTELLYQNSIQTKVYENIAFLKTDKTSCSEIPNAILYTNKKYMVNSELNRPTEKVSEKNNHSQLAFSKTQPVHLSVWKYKQCGELKLYIELHRQADSVSPLEMDKLAKFKFPDYGDNQVWYLKVLLPDSKLHFGIYLYNEKMKFDWNDSKYSFLLQTHNLNISKNMQSQLDSVFHLIFTNSVNSESFDFYAWSFKKTKKRVIPYTNYTLFFDINSPAQDLNIASKVNQQAEELFLNILTQKINNVFSDFTSSSVGISSLGINY